MQSQRLKSRNRQSMGKLTKIASRLRGGALNPPIIYIGDNMYTNIPPYEESGKFILTIEEIEAELLKRRKEALLKRLVTNSRAREIYYKKIRAYERVRFNDEISMRKFMFEMGIHPASPHHPSKTKKTPRTRKPKPPAE